jgi:hypothetical protein
MLGNGHVRFGGRVRETDQAQARHRALTRPNSELKHRGVSDILIACVDGLTGFPESRTRDVDGEASLEPVATEPPAADRWEQRIVRIAAAFGEPHADHRAGRLLAARCHCLTWICLPRRQSWLRGHAAIDGEHGS